MRESPVRVEFILVLQVNALYFSLSCSSAAAISGRSVTCDRPSNVTPVDLPVNLSRDSANRLNISILTHESYFGLALKTPFSIHFTCVEAWCSRDENTCNCICHAMLPDPERCTHETPRKSESRNPCCHSDAVNEQETLLNLLPLLLCACCFPQACCWPAPWCMSHP
jgi:hypothetical protein